MESPLLISNTHNTTDNDSVSVLIYNIFAKQLESWLKHRNFVNLIIGS